RIDFHRIRQRHTYKEVRAVGAATHYGIKLVFKWGGHQLLTSARLLKRGHRCPGVRRKIVAIKGVDSDPSSNTTCVIGPRARARNRCPAIGDRHRHRRARGPSVGTYVVDRDRALRTGVATEVVDLVIESHVSSRLGR